MSVADIERERAGLARIVEANRETVVALREAAEDFARQRNAYANDLTAALKLRDVLRKALAEARDALDCWAVHDHGCPGRVEGDEYCTCGLWLARKAVADALEAK